MCLIQVIPSLRHGLSQTARKLPTANTAASPPSLFSGLKARSPLGLFPALFAGLQKVLFLEDAGLLKSSFWDSTNVTLG